MNINDLTIKQAQDLVEMFAGFNRPLDKNNDHPFLGRYVVIRSYGAGVFAGVLEYYKTNESRAEVQLKEVRRLWKWTSSLSLSDVATNGLKKDSKLDSSNEHYVTDVIEIIPCTSIAEQSIRQYKDFNK
jgi:hypothetical protein